MRIAALEKVRYSCCLSPITGSAALRKSSFLFFLSFLASSAQLTEQYFCIPLLDVNVLPQNAHFLVTFILSLILMFLHSFLYIPSGSERKSTVVIHCQLAWLLLRSSHFVQPFVSVCEPLSTIVVWLEFCGKNKAPHIHRDRNTSQNYAENVEAQKTDCEVLKSKEYW